MGPAMATGPAGMRCAFQPAYVSVRSKQHTTTKHRRTIRFQHRKCHPKRALNYRSRIAAKDSINVCSRSMGTDLSSPVDRRCIGSGQRVQNASKTNRVASFVFHHRAESAAGNLHFTTQHGNRLPIGARRANAASKPAWIDEPDVAGRRFGDVYLDPPLSR